MAIDCLCAGILFADYICAPIDRLPQPGELIPTERIQLAMGGCAANAGLDLAKVGHRVGVSGCVGEDAFGQFIIDSLAGGGVDVSAIHKVGGAGTASTMVVNVKGQDRRFISTPGASNHFQVEHIPAEWVRQAKVFYVGGYLMMPRLETDAMVDLFRTARAAGAKTVLDVVLFGGDHYWNSLKKILPETDVFLPNDDEAAVITGLRDPVEQAEAFASIDPVFGQPSYEEHEELIEVARAHREKFGFPLIISERDDASFAQMLGSYWARMDNSPAAERQETLIEDFETFPLPAECIDRH